MNRVLRRSASDDRRAPAGRAAGEAADLDVRGLTVAYASGGYEVRPLDAFDLHVGDGGLALLLGASGCGKTTLLSALASILAPTSGSIRIGDVEVTSLRGDALVDYRRRRVGVVFQSFNLVPSLTASENVQAPLRLAGVRGAEARRRAEALLHQVDLSDRLHHRPADLSGGQAQRVAIARALAFDPPLLLADEPTAHLDYVQVEGVLSLLRDLATPGRVVVVATHDERLLPLADQLVEMTPRAAPTVGPPATRTLAAGEVLFRQGDIGDRVWVVESGRVELVRTRVDGGEDRLSAVGPGGYFGELAPMFRLRRSATARAAEPTTVVGYGLADFRATRAT